MTLAYRVADDALMLRARKPRAPRSSSRPALMLSSTGLALILAAPGFASPYTACPTPSAGATQTCTTSGTNGYDSLIVDVTMGDNTSAPQLYTVNSGLNIYGASDTYITLMLSLTGGAGSGNDGSGNGYAGVGGGGVTLNNSGQVGKGAPASLPDIDVRRHGVGDNSGVIYGAFARSQGGRGADADDTVIGGGDGGRGGDGGEVIATNSASGSISVSGTVANGMVGFHATSVGGEGGWQDKDATYAQKGGDGGIARNVTLTNDGYVTANGTSSSFVWGIGAEAIGGEGSDERSNGANGGQADQALVLNNGTVTVTATRQGSGALSDGVRGISASSLGGNGRYSDDGDRNGANGGPTESATIQNVGSVTVTMNSAAVDDDGVSGGLVAISRGGDGGQSANTVTNTTGQRGGVGGAAGSANAFNLGAVTTSGDGMAGIVAITEGGTGGNGENSGYGADGGISYDTRVGVNGTISTNGVDSDGVVAIAKGGSGGQQIASSGFADFSSAYAGSGGDAGFVQVDGSAYFNDTDHPAPPGYTGGGAITTHGAYSEGIVAQSIGGSGGNSQGAFVLFGNSSHDSSDGGDAGEVSVNAPVSITTFGDYSSGILAQSIGGGGGNVGDGGGLIAVSGDAGAGAHSADVGVTQQAAISTSGVSAIGIHAQSISGGGGRVANETGVITVGGQGGSSPKADLAQISAFGDIATAGDYAYGALAQSVGGGGGDGGSTFSISGGSIPAVAVGGDGGAAGDGGMAVIETQSNAISTRGGNAHGLIAMSVGGGGGSGGDATSDAVSLTSLAIAGGANSGGDGDTAHVQTSGSRITTTGSHAAGLVALSVGGGGGSGGAASSFDLSFGFSSAVAVGGKGGPGGDGGAAEAFLFATDITTGDANDLTVANAHGVIAASIGGGGGMGGSATSKAVTITVPTEEPQVDGEVSLSLGGSGANAGHGGTVHTILEDSLITTYSDGSNGLVALSVGGGGGIGGDAGASGAMLTLPATGEDRVAFTVNIGVGGNAGGGGAGGDVSVELDTGRVVTHGDYANAVHLASIGGGGGIGGTGSAEKFNLEIPGGGGDDDDENGGDDGGSSSGGDGDDGDGEGGEETKKSPTTLNFTGGIGGTGGSGGDAGALSYSQEPNSSVVTLGDASKGVLLQALGGGGGASQGATVGLGASFLPAAVSLGVGRNGPGGGHGGAITDALIEGSVTTYGAGSDGVFLQAVGGGGGVGGSTGGAGADESGYIKEVNEIKEDAKGKFDLRLMVGGRGGAAGDGGDIGYGDGTGFRFGGTIATYGDHASGLVAQSTGGGGGDGGAGNADTSLSLIRSFVAVGGSGGASGNGGNIKLALLDGEVSTQGVGSYGIFLQTIGGGGGIGGDATRSVCKKLNIGGGWAAQALAAIGGDDETELTPDEMCAEIPSWETFDGQPGVSGDGGEIHVGSADAIASVVTLGDFSHAMIFQSIGGGGGVETTGNSFDANDPDATPDDLSVEVGLGAGGDTSKSAGTGKAVNVQGQFTLSTAGDGAAGLLAQSISGGGGFAGANGLAGVTLGAGGAEHGASGDTPTVTVTLEGGSVIATTGQVAHGVLAQSIAGGGGFAAGALDDSALDGGAIEVTLGASNHTTGDAAAVSVTQAGQVTTTGRFARAIAAQSIGGGGGVYSGIDAGASGPTGVVPVVLGASNTAGVGGTVFVAPKETATQGRGADAVLAQSIGGGGGAADFASRDPSRMSSDIQVTLGTISGDSNYVYGDAVTVQLNGSGGSPKLQTSGHEAYGLLAQSIGGGGGVITDISSATTVSAQLGTQAVGGNNAAGGTVTIDDFVDLNTYGDDAHGIVAQSIGGGGGVARLDTTAGEARLGAVRNGSYDGNMNGGDVSVSVGFGGTSGTAGARSIGIVAQSIGMGGGILSTRGGMFDSLVLGGRYGVGHAGDVHVTLKTNSGSLTTQGEGSHGIVAQSIGGGGGLGGAISFEHGVNLVVFDVSASLEGGQLTAGDGGAVTVDVEDDLTTLGDGAYGVIAQSIGGGGGIGGSDPTQPVNASKYSATSNDGGDTNAGGTVRVTVGASGSVSATGSNSVGVFAQSLGDVVPAPAATQTIAVTVNGDVTGGTGDQGYGVLIHGGDGANTLTVGEGATITSGGDVSVYYLGETSDANSGLTVSNSGHIAGDALGYYADGSQFLDLAGQSSTTSLAAVATSGPTLGRGAMRLVNRRGGLLSGASRYGADVVNHGQMLIGGSDGASALTIDGDFTQSASGETTAVVDFVRQRGDALRVKGDADLDGKLSIAPSAVLKGAVFDLIAVDGTVSGGFDSIRSELFTYGQQVHADGLTIGPIMADFDQKRFGLNASQKEMSRYLEAVFESSDQTYGETFGDLDAAVALDASSFGATLDALTPGASLAAAAANIELSQSRFDSLLSCGDAVWDRRASIGGRCVIAQTSGRSLEQDGRGGATGYDGAVFSMALGLRQPVSEDVTLGVMASYEQSSFNGDGGADSDGDSATLGVSATRAYGDMAVTLAAGGSFGVHDVTRSTTGASGPLSARGEYAAWSAALRGRIDYGLRFGGTLVTPALDLDLIHAAADGYRETGAGAFDLKVEDSSETAFRATPSIGIARGFGLGEATTMTLWGTAGVSFSTSDAYVATARFANATAAGGFSSATPVADVAARVSTGISFAATERLDVGLRYDGAFGDGYSGHAGSLRVEWKF